MEADLRIANPDFDRINSMPNGTYDSFTIPNGSITELLIKSRFDNEPQPPTTLRKLNAKLTFCFLRQIKTCIV